MQPSYAAQLPADHPLAGAHRTISRAARRRVHSRERRIRRNQPAFWPGHGVRRA
jgi:hypothetical protein